MLFTFSQIILFAQSKSEPALAQQYFNEGAYEKAAEIYLKLFSGKNGEKLFYKGYFNTLLKLEEYEKAKEISLKSMKVIKDDLSILIDNGYVLKLLGDLKNSEVQFNKVIENIPPNSAEIKRLSDVFKNYTEIDYAIEVYIKGKSIFNNPTLYNLEIAGLYVLKNDISNVISFHLDELFFRPDQLKTIQNHLQRTLSEDKHYEELEKILLKRVQSNKGFLPYSEMLVWMYMHLGDYNAAFMQARSIDINYGEDGYRILDLARIALSEKYYSVAEKAYQHIIDKGTRNQYYVTATLEMINTKKEKLLQEPELKNENLHELKNAYNNFISEYGKNNTTASASQELAKLYALYFFEVDSAIVLLENVLVWPQIRADIQGMTKLQLGDYYLLNEDHWESTLLYTQVEKAFKGTPVGEEAKFRNAKLSYYKGDFEWAQTQLKFLKASTDQLISNDAINLSVFIADNLNLDTTDHTMALFSAAELYYFQNKFDEANIELEGIKLLYPGHKLTDDVYFLQAKIDIKRRKYQDAIQKLLYITKYHESELLADDALFKVAEIYEINLKDKDKAMEMYQELILNYASSTFAVEAKKRFRMLRGDQIN
jgi:TolA-binding protein